MIAVMLLTVNLPSLAWLTGLVLYLATLLTVISGVLYVWNGRGVLHGAAEPVKAAEKGDAR
jgi:hypothetical protein